ncbi:hypothetical protein LIER_35374 [Lithospermum erythrorhizon]|uniref:Late embryogenesis abundant protein n=1 Tax=Lithospermum erythrorhizon TaxID=34254 RepID=A0AAV3NUB4_LITER
MAANLNSRKLATVGKKFVSQLIASRSSASLLQRRSVHVSVYDKNWEDHVHSYVVPDEVIQLQSEKYWSPHPQTGVFGPATNHQAIGFHSVPDSSESVLGQKTFFRPLENLDKPAQP